MKINPFCIIALVLMSLLPSPLFGIGCKQLNTPKKITAFLVESQRSNPLLRKNVSVSLEISACEGKVCKKKKLRASKKELLHFQRIGKNRRVFSLKALMLRDVSSSAGTGSMSVPNAARMQMRIAEAFPPMTALFYLEPTLIWQILNC